MEFSCEMQHTPESFKRLAHMQYDLFCTGNLVIKSIIGFFCLINGVTHMDAWWGVLLAVYGYYLLNTRYASSNHTANKLTARLEAANLPFPASRFCFYDDRMDIIPLPDGSGEVSSLSYGDFFRMAEDTDHIYIFRNQFGGYMIPKAQIGGNDAVFRRFLREKTGQTVQKKTSPAQRFFKEIQFFQARRNEPPHL